MQSPLNRCHILNLAHAKTGGGGMHSLVQREALLPEMQANTSNTFRCILRDCTKRGMKHFITFVNDMLLDVLRHFSPEVFAIIEVPRSVHG